MFGIEDLAKTGKLAAEMSTRRILAAIFLLIGAASGGMTWMSAKAGEDSKWMFGVFALFFAALAGAALVPEAKAKAKEAAPETSGETRFVSHRFLVLALLLLAVAFVAAILTPLLRS